MNSGKSVPEHMFNLNGSRRKRNVQFKETIHGQIKPGSSTNPERSVLEPSRGSRRRWLSRHILPHFFLEKSRKHSVLSRFSSERSSNQMRKYLFKSLLTRPAAAGNVFLRYIARALRVSGFCLQKSFLNQKRRAGSLRFRSA